MRRRALLLPALLVFAALPALLFMITPAEAGGGSGGVVAPASASPSGSWRPTPRPPASPSGSWSRPAPLPSGSAWKK